MSKAAQLGKQAIHRRGFARIAFSQLAEQVLRDHFLVLEQRPVFRVVRRLVTSDEDVLPLLHLALEVNLGVAGGIHVLGERDGLAKTLDQALLRMAQGDGAKSGCRYQKDDGRSGQKPPCDRDAVTDAWRRIGRRGRIEARERHRRHRSRAGRRAGATVARQFWRGMRLARSPEEALVTVV